MTDKVAAAMTEKIGRRQRPRKAAERIFAGATPVFSERGLKLARAFDAIADDELKALAFTICRENLAAIKDVDGGR